ncbi:PH domain-containing protein [Streptacidiphilus rugosus]|uniref:PH domain-containing protein n=1 Tax=Streptacidiphilus rugosus TaxID=405783 RepID=UPI000689ADB7|nr:PH domain-containing protein [Streptacidiphilus rugosus]
MSTDSPDPAVESLPAETAGWRRLHPFTPFLRGWALLAALVFGVVRNAHDLLHDLTADRVGLGLSLIVPLALGYGFLAWRFTRFRVDGTQLRVERGVLFRRTRDIRLDRVQAIDVVRPLAARLTGVAVLKFDAAGGEKARSTLEYLAVGQAVALRAELLARAAGLAPDAGEAPQRVLYALPGGRLLGSIALSVATWVWAISAAVVSLPLLLEGHLAGLFTALPLLAALWASTFKRFAAEFSFTVAESPDGLRIGTGLLERKHQTVPPGRVQAVRIDEPLLWRAAGWARVRLNVAGQSEKASVLLPVAPKAEAVALLSRLWPGLDLDAVELTRPPRRARWIAPFWAARSGCGHDERVFVSVKGLAVRRTEVIPHAKPQSLALRQNPLTRALGLAELQLHSTKGPVAVTARFRDLAEAQALLDAQAHRSRTGRHTDTPARWATG